MRMGWLGLFWCLALCGAEAQFQVDFDDYQATAEGMPSDLANPDLQLRMFPGAAGSVNAIALNGSEHCAYPGDGWQLPKAGSLNFWLQAYNWGWEATAKATFVQLGNTNGGLTIAKSATPRRLLAQWSDSARSQTMELPIPEAWQPGTWHRIDAVWDDGELKLYLDGEAAETGIATDSAVEFPWPGRLTLNAHAGAPEWITAYDELRFSPAVTDAAAIREEYRTQRQREAAEKGHMARQLATIPRTASTIVPDGKLTEEVWSQATRIPLLIPFQSEGTQAQGEISLLWNADALLVGVDIPHPATVGSVYTAPDSEVYLGDCVELHLRHPDGTQYQFIFNPYGGSYDSRNEDVSWNSHLTMGAARTDGGWSVEALIPLADLGLPEAGSEWSGNFCAAVRSPRLAYISWSKALNEFKLPEGFGTIQWGADAAAVRLERIGEVRDGRLHRSQINGVGGAETGVPGTRFDDAGQAEIPTGAYQLAVRGHRADGSEIFCYQWDTVVKNPLELSLRPRPDLGELEVSLDRVNASAPLHGILRLRNTDGSADVYHEPLQLIGAHTALKLPLTTLQSGPAEVSFVTQEDAAPTARAVFTVPDMTPYRERVGVNHDVPDPWQPVQSLGDGRYQVLNRVYAFADGPFPVSIDHGGDRILAQTPELIAQTASGEEEWQWEDFRELEAFDDFIRFGGRGHSGELVVDWEGELWFDGMYLFTLTIRPPEGGVELRKLQLRWRIPAEFARYLLHPRFQPWDGEKIELTWNTGEVFSTLITQGVEKGLAWWAESDANWVNAPDEKQIRIQRQGDQVEVAVTMISQPAPLREAAAYTMSFLATPGRTAPAGWRNFAMMTDQPESHYLASTGSWSKTPNPDDIRYATTHIPRDPAAFAEAMRSADGRAICYTLPGFLCSFDPEYSYFGALWENSLAFRWPGNDKESGTPYEAIACCGDGIIDLMAYRLERLMRENPGFGGLFYDICHVSQCANRLHGHGGVDQFGKHYSTSIALHLRNYLLRIYKLLHAEGKILINHAHSNFHPMVHNFSDYWAPGEEFYYPLAKNPYYGYCEDIPRPAYQSAWSVAARGVGILMLFQNTRIGTTHPDAKPLLGYLASEEAARRSFTPVLLHDIIPTGWWLDYRFAGRIQALRRAVALDEAQFHGYWFDDAVSSASDGVFASYYTWSAPSPYRVLLVVANLSREERAAALKVDFERLGVAPDSPWIDAESGDAMSSEFTLPANHFRLIGIR